VGLSKAWPLVAALSAFACVPPEIPISLEVQRGDLVVVADLDLSSAPTSVDFFVYEPGVRFRLPTQAGFALFRVKSSDLLRPSGSLVEEDFRGLRARRVSDPLDIRSDPSQGGAGYCGRCLVPSSAPPQIVNDGDSCALPPYADGELYAETSNGQKLRTDSGAASVLDGIKAQIRLDWPKACACAPETAAPLLAGFDVRPVAPTAAPLFAAAVAERSSDGFIAGFGERGLMTIAKNGAPQVIAPVSDLDLDVQAAIAVRSGPFAGDFLVAMDSFSPAFFLPSAFYRFRITPDGALVDHAMMTMLSDHNVDAFRYLKDGDDPAQPYPQFPIYGLGTRQVLGYFSSGLVACEESRFSCQIVNIPDCVPPVNSSVHDIFVMADDTGVAIADNAFYYKQSSATPDPGPSPTDAWTCNPLASAYAFAPGAGSSSVSIAITRLDAMGRVGNRLFVCADESVDACAPSRSLVLSATVGASRGRFPSPDWRVVATSRDGVGCHHFIPVPGDPSRARLVWSSGETIDFDASGAIKGHDQIARAFPPSSLPWFQIIGLDGGSTLMRSFENALYVLPNTGTSSSTARFQQIYGPASFEDSAYHAIVETECGFLALGRSDAIVEYVTQQKGARMGAMPGLRTFPWGALHGHQDGDVVRGAVRDTQSSASGLDVILAVGFNQRSKKPFARRIYAAVDSSCAITLNDTNEIEIPSAFDGSALVGVAETGPGSFVAIVEGTRLIYIGGASAAEIPVGLDLVNPPDPCTHITPRLDALEAIDGRSGVAWAVGDQGLILRIAGGRVDRYKATTTNAAGMVVDANADWTAVRASCPDRVLIAGSLPTELLGDLTSAFQVVHQGTPDGQCSPVDAVDVKSKTDPVDDPLIVREYPESCSGLPGPNPVRYTAPAAFLRDGSSAAIGLGNGYIHRFTPDRPERIKVPFGVIGLAQDASGVALFGGKESRLAIGTTTTAASH
jgi:hypothetical protein